MRQRNTESEFRQIIDKALEIIKHQADHQIHSLKGYEGLKKRYDVLLRKYWTDEMKQKIFKAEPTHVQHNPAEVYLTQRIIRSFSQWSCSELALTERVSYLTSSKNPRCSTVFTMDTVIYDNVWMATAKRYDTFMKKYWTPEMKAKMYS